MIESIASRCRVKPGDRYGKRVVLGLPFHVKVKEGVVRNRPYVVVKCDCGKIDIESAINIRKASSCGCDRDTLLAATTTHGETHTRLNKVWRGIKQRCLNPNFPQYKDYGGRGITICDEWMTYEPFRDWAKANGYADNLEIDRENNDLGYSPENCRFVTKLRNNRNRSITIRLTAFGETKAIGDWVEDPRCAVQYGSLKSRLRYGWSHEEAISTPLTRQKR